MVDPNSLPGAEHLLKIITPAQYLIATAAGAFACLEPVDFSEYALAAGLSGLVLGYANALMKSFRPRAPTDTLDYQALISSSLSVNAFALTYGITQAAYQLEAIVLGY